MNAAPHYLLRAFPTVVACTNLIISLSQEQALDAKNQAQSPEDTEDLSPLPTHAQGPVRRRGGISAEPVSEEDATSYVKKVT